METLKGRRNQLAASRTALGWALHGNNPDDQSKSPHSSMAISLCSKSSEVNQSVMDRELNELVKSSFDLDNVGIKHVDRVKPADKRAYEIFSNTTRLTAPGWEVGLLSRYRDPKLPNNKPEALKRLYSLEQKMDQDRESALLDDAEINKMLKAGYAERVYDNDFTNHT